MSWLQKPLAKPSAALHPLWDYGIVFTVQLGTSPCTVAPGRGHSSYIYTILATTLVEEESSVLVGSSKVLDVCCVTQCTTTASILERLKEFRNVFAEDGIHYTPNGYNNLAKRTIGCLRTLLTEKPKVVKKHTFFWRGYRSPHGSLANNPVRLSRGLVGSSVRGNNHGRARGAMVGRRSRSRFFHPYNRW